jgi:hypothetical protein
MGMKTGLAMRLHKALKTVSAAEAGAYTRPIFSLT